MTTPDANEITRIQDRLRSLTGPPKPRQRLEVNAALASKWEGVRSHALKVLGRWGDDASKKQLIHFLEDHISAPYKWAIRGVAMTALLPLLTERDAVWALDYFFRAREFELPGGPDWALTRLSSREVLRARAQHELRADSEGRRLTAHNLLRSLQHRASMN